MCEYEPICLMSFFSLKLLANSFLTRFLQTVQGEKTKTIDDVRNMFEKLQMLELADVADLVSEKDYISLDHFEAYLVRCVFFE